MKEIGHYTNRILHNLDILEVVDKQFKNSQIHKLRLHIRFLEESNLYYNKISNFISDLDLYIKNNADSDFLISLIKNDLICLKLICINKTIKEAILSLNLYIRENQYPLTTLELEHFETFKEEIFLQTFENENKNLKNKEIVKKLYLIISQLIKEFKELKKSIEIWSIFWYNFENLGEKMNIEQKFKHLSNLKKEANILEEELRFLIVKLSRKKGYVWKSNKINFISYSEESSLVSFVVYDNIYSFKLEEIIENESK